MNHGSVALVACFLCLTLLSGARAQDPPPDVQPESLIHLTGVLEAGKKPHASTFPLIEVWIGGQPWLFRVTEVKPVIPAYPAEKELRKVSGLGLRLLAKKDVLAALQAPEMHNRPIMIEGWLHAEEGRLNVKSVRVAEKSRDRPPE